MGVSSLCRQVRSTPYGELSPDGISNYRQEETPDDTGTNIEKGGWPRQAVSPLSGLMSGFIIFLFVASGPGPSGL